MVVKNVRDLARDYCNLYGGQQKEMCEIIERLEKLVVSEVATGNEIRTQQIGHLLPVIQKGKRHVLPDGKQVQSQDKYIPKVYFSSSFKKKVSQSLGPVMPDEMEALNRKGEGNGAKI